MDTVIRVLLTAQDAQVVHAVRSILACQEDMEVIEARPCRGLELFLLLRRTEPDVLALELEVDRISGLCSQVFGEYPDLTILAISPDDQGVTLHRLKLDSMALPAWSIDSVADEIRAAVRS
jgi:DNA-binding NarL/FixJ family response regulator